MGVVEGLEQLADQVHRAGDRQRAALLFLQPGRVDPLHVIHREMEDPVGLAHLMERHDVRVIERLRICASRRNRSVSTFEAVMAGLIVFKATTPPSTADGEVDDPHAAPAQLADDLVTRDWLGMGANPFPAGRTERDCVRLRHGVFRRGRGPDPRQRGRADPATTRDRAGRSRTGPRPGGMIYGETGLSRRGRRPALSWEPSERT